MAEIELVPVGPAEEDTLRDKLIALVKQFIRRSTRTDAGQTRNLIVQIGNLFGIVVDLRNAGRNCGIDLRILIAEILIVGFKLIHQATGFTQHRLTCCRVFRIAHQGLQAFKEVLQGGGERVGGIGEHIVNF